MEGWTERQTDDGMGIPTCQPAYTGNKIKNNMAGTSKIYSLE